MNVYAAEIDENGTVLRVVVIPESEEFRVQEFCSIDLGLGGNWKLTKKDKSVDGAFAGPGMVWQEAKKQYTKVKPYPSWELKNDDWHPPKGKERPNLPENPLLDVKWDEETDDWKIVDFTPYDETVDRSYEGSVKPK